jgi:predicted ATPase/class 3 adenylate cyclase
MDYNKFEKIISVHIKYFTLLEMKALQPSPATSAAERQQSFPYGTVTFLFADIEGSTPLWEGLPDEMRAAVAQYRLILRQAIEANNGHEFQIFGDSFQAAFHLASDGLSAALSAQRSLRDAHWGPTGPLKVRMGLHTGPAAIDSSGDAPYAVSHTLNRSARVMSAGYGEQILLSQESADLVERELPPGVSLSDLGQHQLKGMTRPEQLYQVVVPDLPQAFPPLTTGIIRPNNLPANLTSFIGREQDIIEVCQRVRDSRLVTLTGTGGTGKTRLALRVAQEMLVSFKDGIWLVELAPVADPELLDQTVASTLGLHKTTESSYQVILESYLCSRRLLLILDNCEHLLEACARLAHHLLQHCPQLTLLATSRQTLSVSGEMTYYVPSLVALDPSEQVSRDELAQTESVRLFTDRAAAVLPSFKLSNETLWAAARICHRLDGIPLAIELAAARVNVLSVEQIAARLDDRFRLLTGGSRADLPRHQTLRASIDWSYNLLPEPQRVLLQRLSVFAGGWTLPAAEATCAGEGLEDWAILDALSGLVEKSLVVADHQSGSEVRYHMLETIRQYAQERLDCAGLVVVVHDHHLAYFLSLAETFEPLMRTPQIYELLERLDIELDNVRGALSWALGKNDRRGAEQALRILSSLFYFWFVRALLFEEDGWMQRAFKLIPDDEPQTAGLKAWSLLTLALQKGQSSHFVRETLDHLNKSIAIFRGAGDFPGIRLKLALALAMRKSAINQFLTFFPPEPPIDEEAERKDGEESISLVQEFLNSKDPEIRWLVSWIYLIHARMEFTGNGQDQVLPLTQIAHDFNIQLGDQIIELLRLETIVWLYLPDNPDQCMAYAKQGINLARRLGDQSLGAIVNFHATLGFSAYLKGQFFDLENNFHVIEENYRHSAVASNVWGETWNVRTQGIAAVNQLDAGKASTLLIKALDLALTNQDSYGVLSALLHFAGLALILGQNQAAARLLGCVEAQFEGFFKGMDLLPDRMEFDKHTNRLREKLSEADITTFWNEGQTMPLEQAIELARALGDKS